MQNKASTRAKHIDFILLDFVAVEISFVLAYFVRFRDIMLDERYQILNYTVLIIYFVLMLFSSFHKNILRRGYLKELWATIVVNTELIFSVFALLFVIKKSETYSRLLFGYFIIADILIMYVIRIMWKKHVLARFKAGKNNSNILIVTYSDRIEDLYRSIQKKNNGYYRFVGAVLIDKYESDTICGLNVVHTNEILDFAKANVINEVFVFANNKDSGHLVSRFSRMGFTVHVILNLELRSFDNLALSQIGNYTILTTTISNASLGQLLIKRIFDIIVGIVGVIITCILTIFVAPIIKIQSPGPVFFKQKRVGKNGKFFTMYKFRSMCIDAEERKKDLLSQDVTTGPMFKMENDPRVFPAGRIIRKTSIDEFPQFWNILKGDMSLVGTRPPTVDEYEQYSNHHMSRLAMKPGLTGMWQTSGRSDIKDFEEIVRLDNDYIRHFSLGLDIKIIFKTFLTVFGMKGSK